LGYSTFILLKLKKMGGRYGQLSVYQQEDEHVMRGDRKEMKEKAFGVSRQNTTRSMVMDEYYARK
jgi:hypothetical protein